MIPVKSVLYLRCLSEGIKTKSLLSLPATSVDICRVAADRNRTPCQRLLSHHSKPCLVLDTCRKHSLIDAGRHTGFVPLRNRLSTKADYPFSAATVLSTSSEESVQEGDDAEAHCRDRGVGDSNASRTPLDVEKLRVDSSASVSTTPLNQSKKFIQHDEETQNRGSRLKDLVETESGTLLDVDESGVDYLAPVSTSSPKDLVQDDDEEIQDIDKGIEDSTTERRPFSDVEEFGVDILAESDDPPILEDFARLPLPSLSYTLSSYVEHSETLQRLIQMGVDLSEVEKRQGVSSALVKMDFERDVAGKLVFLDGLGVRGSDLARFVTKNPHILLETVDELEARVEYLKKKKFTDNAISKIVNRAPYFLSFSVFRVDRKLGYLQQLLRLKGKEVREVITREPMLVTHKVSRIQENVFVLREQLGFQNAELKALIVKEPKLLLRGKHRLISIFDYLHNVMDIPHRVMLAIPWVLHGRVHKLQERHQYLKSLSRDVYDPKLPQYVPLDTLMRLPDEAFCEQVAKTSLEDYNLFLKNN